MANQFFEVVGNLLDPADMLRGGGELAIRGGQPVLWAGPQMGWQSPESFYKYVGPEQFKALTQSVSPAEIYAKATTLQGYKPPGDRKPAEGRTGAGGAGEDRGTLTPGNTDGQIPPPPPVLPPPPNPQLPETRAPYPGATIPQNADQSVNDLIKYLKELTDPERIRQTEEMRLQNLLKSQMLTSELTRQGERARYARDIEKENITAWKERQVAQINANAVQAAALGTAMISAFAPPNAQALSSTLQAALQPYSNMSFKRG